MGSENAHGCAQNAENSFGFDFLSDTTRQWISQSHRTSRSWRNLGFISECQSKQRTHTHSPKKPKKFKHTLPAWKLMTTVFWDRKGVLVVECMQRRITITSQVYCKTKNCGAIQTKRRGMLTFGVVLLHDNASPHTAVRTLALLEHFNWEFFEHRPCSPDRAPSDYHLFTWSSFDHSASIIMKSWWKVSKRGWAHRRQSSLT
jgi:hypothetical protein